MQILSPIKPYTRRAWKGPTFPFAVNILFNEASALACFDKRREDGIDNLFCSQPRIISLEGLAEEVGARALAFFQASVSPGFPRLPSFARGSGMWESTVGCACVHVGQMTVNPSFILALALSPVIAGCPGSLSVCSQSHSSRSLVTV